MSKTPSLIEDLHGVGSNRGADSDDSQVKFLDAALWERLSSAETLNEIAQAWLILLCRATEGARRGLLLLAGSEPNTFDPVAVWPDDAGKMPTLVSTAQIALTERRGVARAPDQGQGARSDLHNLITAYPILLEGKLRGAVAIEIDGGERNARLVLRQLQWAVAWIRDHLRAAEAGTQRRLLHRSSMALDLIGATLEHDGFKAAAMAAITEIALRCNFDRVSLGFIKRGNVRVQVISHSAQFGQQMNLIRCIGEAMDEAVDQRTNIVYPPPATQVVAARAHAELARIQGDQQILTTPLFSIDRFIGAMTFERSGSEPLDMDTVALLEATAATIGPILEEKRRNDRWIGSKVAEAGKLQIVHLFGPGHVGQKLAVLAAVALLAFFSLAHQTYRVDAESQIEGLVRRAIVAPYDGFLQTANTRAGDTVRQGDIVASLDDRDMVLERLRWVTERQQRTFEYDKALASRQPAVINVTRSQISQAEAQIQLLDEQLSRVRMRAPIDGLVISGDQSQMIGASITRGQVLFEIAPLTGYRVILSVDERQVGAVTVGQTGNLVTTALPGEPFPFVVEKLIPIAEVKDGKNTFRVEGRILETSDRLRPGMEGVAKIDVEQRLLIWVWTKPVIDWARIWFWRWTP